MCRLSSYVVRDYPTLFGGGSRQLNVGTSMGVLLFTLA